MGFGFLCHHFQRVRGRPLGRSGYLNVDHLLRIQTSASFFVVFNIYTVLSERMLERPPSMWFYCPGFILDSSLPKHCKNLLTSPNFFVCQEGETVTLQHCWGSSAVTDGQCFGNWSTVWRRDGALIVPTNPLAQDIYTTGEKRINTFIPSDPQLFPWSCREVKLFWHRQASNGTPVAWPGSQESLEWALGYLPVLRAIHESILELKPIWTC